MFTLLLLLLLILLLVFATAFRVNRTKVMKLKELKPRLPTPPATFFVEIDFFVLFDFKEETASRYVYFLKVYNVKISLDSGVWCIDVG
jgi:hypothetical protein